MTSNGQGEPDTPQSWREWLVRLKTQPVKLAAVILGILAAIWMICHDLIAAHDRNASAESVTVQQLAAWLKQGNERMLHEVAFSNPPETLYDIATFLVEAHSPQALETLRHFCARPDGALVVAELADKLPTSDALPLCRGLLQNADERVRHGAIATLFSIAARPGGFTGPWPEGMSPPGQRPVLVESAHKRWRKDQANGLDASFEEWMYKEAVTGFVCSDDPDSKLGRKSEAVLIRQLDGELRKRFGFELESRNDVPQ